MPKNVQQKLLHQVRHQSHITVSAAGAFFNDRAFFGVFGGGVCFSNRINYESEPLAMLAIYGDIIKETYV